MNEIKNRPIEVLLIEDDPDDEQIFSTALRELGMVTLLYRAANFDQASTFLMYEKPSIIFMDLNMPGINGKDALVSLRRNERYRSIPIIILTTSSCEWEKAECVKSGADYYVTKPSSSRDYNDMIRKILSQFVPSALATKDVF
jgi:DNA-binding response OmpR family regulator